MKDIYIKQLIKAAQYAQKKGLCKHRSGNFSVINEERTKIAITPSGLDRADLTEADILILDMEGTILKNDNNRKPSSEWLMHLAAYGSRPDFQAVAHTHSPFATTFSIKGDPILPVVFEAYFYGWRTAVTDLCCLPGTKELAESVRQPLQEASAVLLRSHGVLTGGKTVMEAVEKAIYIEEVAEIYHHCLQLCPDGAVPVIKDEQFLAYQRHMM